MIPTTASWRAISWRNQMLTNEIGLNWFQQSEGNCADF